MAKEGKVIDIHVAEELDAIVEKETKNGTMIVINFSASWCGPCRFIDPIFAELATMNADNIIFLKVDINEVRGLSKNYGIGSVPTFVFVKGGKEVHRFVGADKVRLERVIAAAAAASTA